MEQQIEYFADETTAIEDIASSTEQENKLQTKSVEIEHTFTEEEKAKLGEKAGLLEQEIFTTENQIEELKTMSKNKKIILDELSQRRREFLLKIDAGKETRDVQAYGSYDWNEMVIYWHHPETNEVIETQPIPAEERQESIGFNIEKKNGSSNTTEITERFKETWYDHLRNVEFIEFPRGVTASRLDKIKDMTKNDRRFIDLIKAAGEPQNAAHYTQKSLAAQFFSLSRVILEENGFIK